MRFIVISVASRAYATAPFHHAGVLFLPNSASGAPFAAAAAVSMSVGWRCCSNVVEMKTLKI